MTKLFQQPGARRLIQTTLPVPVEGELGTYIRRGDLVRNEEGKVGTVIRVGKNGLWMDVRFRGARSKRYRIPQAFTKIGETISNPQLCPKDREE